MRFVLLSAMLLVALFHSACSSRQAYATGQSWQRSECNKIVDFQERRRCMASASTSFEDYQREAEAAKKPR